jgi:microcystin-dependent protein
MALESATYISGLVPTNPVHGDGLSQADAHLRLIKATLQSTFTGTVVAPMSVVALAAAAAMQPSGAGPVILPAVGGVATMTVGGVQALGLTSTGGLTVGPSATVLSWVGEVRMHSGSVASIPLGWALCNGANGTINLTNQFILGAGGAWAPGAVGGASQVSLAIGNLPSHSHVVADAGHTHGVYDAGHTHPVSDPGHSHSSPADVLSWVGSGGSTSVSGGTNTQGSLLSLSSAMTGVTTQTAPASVSLYNSVTGVTLQNTGSGSAFSIIPPFYALCFVQRIA